MKKMLMLLSSVMLSVSLMSGVTAYAATGDIVDVANKNGSFKTLEAALEKAGLVGTLQGAGPFTVFAPTDAAFEKLLKELNITADQLLSQSGLKDVLTYHVVAGKVMSTDLTDGMTPDTVLGDKLKVDLSNGVMINNSKVTTADVAATNGVIHVIDTVLVPESFKLDAAKPAEPETVVDVALSSEDFSTLVAALQKADLVDTLKGDGPFTVFAPTNAAFEKLLKDLNITAADLLSQPDLSKVLLYHVVSGNVMSTDLTDGMDAKTINGETVKVALGDKVMINNATVTTPDLKAGNGVVHVIDTVLVPQDFVYQKMDGSTDIPKTGDMGLAPFALGAMVILTGAVILKRKNSLMKTC